MPTTLDIHSPVFNCRESLAATIIISGESLQTEVIFSNKGAVSIYGGMPIQNEKPKIIVRSSVITNAKQGDVVNINIKGSYKIFNINPDQQGLTIVELTRG